MVDVIELIDTVILCLGLPQSVPKSGFDRRYAITQTSSRERALNGGCRLDVPCETSRPGRSINKKECGMHDAVRELRAQPAAFDSLTKPGKTTT